MSPDMEDLLRKAAEAYPLKEMEDRWDEIASGLIAPLPPVKKQSRYRRYLALLFLLLLFLFTGNYLINFKVVSENHLSEKLAQERNESVNNEERTSVIKNLEVVKKDIDEDIIKKGRDPLEKSASVDRKDVFHSKKFNLESTLTRVDQQASFDAPAEMFRTKYREILSDRSIELQPNNFSFNLYKPLFSFTNAEPKSSTRVFRKRFYYGIAGGISFNSVKEQSLGAGWNFGLTGGYYIGQKLSLETGAIVSQKKYWTSGDYFSMKKLGASMPPPMKIMEVDGNNKVIEIPLHVRYDFVQQKKRSLFSSAGFSSYLLTKEYNRYHVSNNGSMQMMYGTYKNNQQYFAASLDIGIGYEQKLGNNNRVRFEPYIQLPVKGIGMGNLQIMSTGMRVALTRRNK